MTRFPIIYLAVEAIAVAVYGWLLWRWMGWKTIGSNAFPGSPDARWLYFNSLENFQLATGFLQGLWIGGIVYVFALQADLHQCPMRVRNTLRAALIVLSPVALIAGHILETHATRQ
jgi:hypothetical protein